MTLNAEMNARAIVEPGPTMLEADLDSICLTLSKMTTKLNREPLLDHISDFERAELRAAIERTHERLAELTHIVGSEPAA